MFLIIFILIMLRSVFAFAGCPTNELIYNTLTPLVFSYESRDGTGEDTTNTANKRVAISYWNGTAVRWWNATDWTSTTEQLLTMAQVSGSQYRYNFTPNATVSGQYLMIRFDETDNVDVTVSCLAYVQPEDRIIVADNVGINLDDTAGTLNSTEIPKLDAAYSDIDNSPLATGTENGAQTSTATRVYTALSNNTRRYIGMCLENASTNERTKIVGYGSSPANYFDVRGFSAVVGDGVTLNIHTTGCQ